MTEKMELGPDLMEDELEILLEGDLMTLLGVWTREAKSDEERAKIATTLRNSGFQFDRLRTILRQMYRTAQENKEKVSNPNWRDRVAYELGYQKAIRDIYRLIPKTTKE